MNPRSRKSRDLCVVVAAAIAFTIAVSTELPASVGAAKPAIDHQRVASVPNDGYPQVEAVVESDIEGEEIRKARACFRAEQHPDFYCVEMEKKEEQVLGCSDGDDDVFVGVLPIPNPSTAAIVYYIEATDGTFATEQTPVHTATTSDEPVGTRFSGTEPNITVIATVEGAAEIPPGFRADGIVKFVTVAGVTTALSSGVGTSVAIGAAAAGAAGAAAGVIVSNNQSTTTSTSDPITTTTTTSFTTSTTTSASTTTTTATPATPKACFSTTPDPPNIQTNESVRFDASCSRGDRGPPSSGAVMSYQWDFGDGRRGSERPDVNRVFFEPGEFPVTLTVTNDAGVRDSVTRNVTVTEPGVDLSVRLSAQPSIPRGTGLNGGFQVTNEGTNPARDVVLRYTVVNSRGSFAVLGYGVFNGNAATCVPSGEGTPTILVVCRATRLDPGDSFGYLHVRFPARPQTRTFRARVTSSTLDLVPNNNSAAITTMVTLRTTDDEGRRPLDVETTSHLDVPPNDGSVAAFVTVNDSRTYPANSSGASSQRWRAQAGRNRVVARVNRRPEAEGRWQFDFANTLQLVNGSLRVESGEIVAVGPRSVVFRVRGNTSQEFAFTFDLEP